MNKRKPKKQRIWELDFLRFIAILLMFIVHYNYAIIAAYNINPVYDPSPLYLLYQSAKNVYYGVSGDVLKLSCGILFTVLSGITSSMTTEKRGLIKAAKYFIVAMCLTLVTYLASIILSSRLTIVFGVLHMLSVSAAITCGLSLLLKTMKLKPLHITVCFAVLGIAVTTLGFIYRDSLYGIEANTNIFAPIGITAEGFFSADYYPLIPWTGVYFLGYAIGRLLYPVKRSLIPAVSDMRWHIPFTTLGRYSIQFYLIHQVVLVGFFGLLFYFA